MTGFKRTCTALALAALLGSGPLFADEVHEQLDTARSAYDSGDLRGAVQALQFAVTKIQEQMTAKMWKLLPEPLAGWQADEPQSQSAGLLSAIAGTNLSRRYYDDAGAEIEINMVADSPMLGMMGMMFSSPYMMQATPNTAAFTHDGYRGIAEHAKGTSEWEMKLMVGTRVYVNLTGSGLSDDEPLKAYLDAMDLAAIEKAMTE
ncbi:hypothetical protein Thimo_0628 [Thioflavicoccus mobilis 8321]|uniref:DUF3887 domain-containing protein n=1 Tax=Thioflavicoccus mobilis 8321 TaxID=765912 RepID=L0GW07_9GAMM|nr:hypothetical protein [Thioflavicoccus mobilis]AGA89469.1 hypothetical protein Thimo_0628 [Thioflavicoccus mobilis 8321]